MSNNQIDINNFSLSDLNNFSDEDYDNFVRELRKQTNNKSKIDQLSTNDFVPFDNQLSPNATQTVLYRESSTPSKSKEPTVIEKLDVLAPYDFLNIDHYYDYQKAYDKINNNKWQTFKEKDSKIRDLNNAFKTTGLEGWYKTLDKAITESLVNRTKAIGADAHLKELQEHKYPQKPVTLNPTTWFENKPTPVEDYIGILLNEATKNTRKQQESTTTE